MTISNKVQTLANDFAASTSTTANKVQFFTEALGGVASTSNKTVLFDFVFPRGFGVGPVFQGVAQVLRQSGVGPTWQGNAQALRVLGVGPVFQGTADSLPLPPSTLVPALNKGPGRSYGRASANIVKLGESLGISLTGTPTATLYTAQSGRRVVGAYITVVCTAATGVTVVATASASSAGAPLFQSQPMLGLDAADKMWRWPLTVGAAKSSGGAQSITFSVDSPATATAQTADVRLYGYLV